MSSVSKRYVVVSEEKSLYDKVCRRIVKEDPESEIRRASTLKEGCSIAGDARNGIVLADLLDSGYAPPRMLPGRIRREEEMFPDDHVPSRGCASDDIRYIKYYIRMHLGEELGLRLLARRMGISPNYLCTIFKQQENMSIGKFIEKSRLEKAAYLLETENTRTSDIARKVGYKSSSYFSRVFRNVYGTTPTGFREKLRRGIYSHS